jgi:hypothetical protein
MTLNNKMMTFLAQNVKIVFIGLASSQDIIMSNSLFSILTWKCHLCVVPLVKINIHTLREKMLSQANKSKYQDSAFVYFIYD